MYGYYAGRRGEAAGRVKLAVSIRVVHRVPSSVKFRGGKDGCFLH